MKRTKKQSVKQQKAAGKRRNRTIIKARKAVVIAPNPPRRRNKPARISEADISKFPAHVQDQLRAEIGQIGKAEAKASTPAQKRQVATKRRSFLSRLGTRLRVLGQTKKMKVSARDLGRCPRKVVKVRARHETDAISKAKSKLGSNYDQFKMQNPRYLVTAEETVRKARDLGILDDRSAKAALARAKKIYGGQGLKKFAARKRNASLKIKAKKRVVKNCGSAAKRRNSSAEQQRREFAGSVAGHKEMYFPTGTPQGLSTLGPLALIRTDAGDLKPINGTAYLCQDGEGKLHIGASKNAPLINGSESFGAVSRVEYVCRKPHLGYPDPITWYHDFESPRPRLEADGQGGLRFVGGNYTIRREGIVG